MKKKMLGTKAKQWIGLLISGMMAVTAVVPWTGMPVYAKSDPKIMIHGISSYEDIGEISAVELQGNAETGRYTGGINIDGDKIVIADAEPFPLFAGKDESADITIEEEDGDVWVGTVTGNPGNGSDNGNGTDQYTISTLTKHEDGSSGGESGEPPVETDAVDEIRIVITDNLAQKNNLSENPLSLRYLFGVHLEPVCDTAGLLVAPYETMEWDRFGLGVEWYSNAWATDEYQNQLGEAITEENYQELLNGVTFVTSSIFDTNPYLTWDEMSVSDEVLEDAPLKGHALLKKGKVLVLTLDAADTTPEIETREITVKYVDRNLKPIISDEYYDVDVEISTEDWADNFVKEPTFQNELNGMTYYGYIIDVVDAPDVVYIQYVDAEQAQKIYVHFYISNEEAASYKDGDSLKKNVDRTAASENEKVTFPELQVAEGYTLTGWQVTGQQTAVWDKEAYEIGLIGWPVYNGEDNTGHVSITPLFTKQEEPSEPDTSEPDTSEPDDRYPPRPDLDDDDDETVIPDESTPLAPGTDDGTGAVVVPEGPGGDDTVIDDDVPLASLPTEEIDGDETPVTNPPKTGVKTAGSVALLAGSLAVALATLKKRHSK